MNKVIIFLCAVLAVAYAGDQVDNYIKINVDQYHRVLDDYEAKLAYFTLHYEGRVEAVGVQKELLAASIVHTEERLTPLLLLSGSSKECVLKYRGSVANVELTKQAITQCQLVATTKFRNLLDATLKVRNALKDQIQKYEQEVSECAHDNYTSCVSNVTSKVNKFTYENQKSFEYELEAAECLAKANVKKFVDCTYSVQIDVLTKLGEVDALVGRCLTGMDQCKPCEEYTCSEATNVYGRYEKQTIANPLYGRKDSPKCLMLNVH